MKAYVITTGALFALLTVLHVWRMLAERHLAQDPWYLLVTALAAGLGLWAWRVLRAERT
jgi:hypothetical protein